MPDTFDESKNYTSVRYQEARPVLSSEMNEMQDSIWDFLEVWTNLVFGDAFSGEAFLAEESTTDTVNNLRFNSGQAVISGIKAFAEAAFEYKNQNFTSDIPNPLIEEEISKIMWNETSVPALTTPSGTPTESNRGDLIILNYVVREITSAEDPGLINASLGTETATRYKVEFGVTVLEDFLTDSFEGIHSGATTPEEVIEEILKESGTSAGTWRSSPELSYPGTEDYIKQVVRVPIAWISREESDTDITAVDLKEFRHRSYTSDIFAKMLTEVTAAGVTLYSSTEADIADGYLNSGYKYPIEKIDNKRYQMYSWTEEQASLINRSNLDDLGGIAATTKLRRELSTIEGTDTSPVSTIYKVSFNIPRDIKKVSEEGSLKIDRLSLTLSNDPDISAGGTGEVKLSLYPVGSDEVTSLHEKVYTLASGVTDDVITFDLTDFNAHVAVGSSYFIKISAVGTEFDTNPFFYARNIAKPILGTLDKFVIDANGLITFNGNRINTKVTIPTATHFSVATAFKHTDTGIKQILLSHDTSSIFIDIDEKLYILENSVTTALTGILSTIDLTKIVLQTGATTSDLEVFIDGESVYTSSNAEYWRTSELNIGDAAYNFTSGLLYLSILSGTPLTQDEVTSLETTYYLPEFYHIFAAESRARLFYIDENYLFETVAEAGYDKIENLFELQFAHRISYLPSVGNFTPTNNAFPQLKKLSFNSAGDAENFIDIVPADVDEVTYTNGIAVNSAKRYLEDTILTTIEADFSSIDYWNLWRSKNAVGIDLANGRIKFPDLPNNSYSGELTNKALWDKEELYVDYKAKLTSADLDTKVLMRYNKTYTAEDTFRALETLTKKDARYLIIDKEISIADGKTTFNKVMDCIGYIKGNPAERLGKIYVAPKKDGSSWEEDIEDIRISPVPKIWADNYDGMNFPLYTQDTSQDNFWKQTVATDYLYIDYEEKVTLTKLFVNANAVLDATIEYHDGSTWVESENSLTVSVVDTDTTTDLTSSIYARRFRIKFDSIAEIKKMLFVCEIDGTEYYSNSITEPILVETTNNTASTTSTFNNINNIIRLDENYATSTESVQNIANNSRTVSVMFDEVLADKIGFKSLYINGGSISVAHIKVFYSGSWHNIASATSVSSEDLQTWGITPTLITGVQIEAVSFTGNPSGYWSIDFLGVIEQEINSSNNGIYKDLSGLEIEFDKSMKLKGVDETNTLIIAGGNVVIDYSQDTTYANKVFSKENFTGFQDKYLIDRNYQPLKINTTLSDANDEITIEKDYYGGNNNLRANTNGYLFDIKIDVNIDNELDKDSAESKRGVFIAFADVELNGTIENCHLDNGANDTSGLTILDYFKMIHNYLEQGAGAVSFASRIIGKLNIYNNSSEGRVAGIDVSTSSIDLNNIIGNQAINHYGGFSLRQSRMKAQVIINNKCVSASYNNGYLREDSILEVGYSDKETIVTNLDCLLVVLDRTKMSIEGELDVNGGIDINGTLDVSGSSNMQAINTNNNSINAGSGSLTATGGVNTGAGNIKTKIVSGTISNGGAVSTITGLPYYGTVISFSVMYRQNDLVSGDTDYRWVMAQDSAYQLYEITSLRIDWSHTSTADTGDSYKIIVKYI